MYIPLVWALFLEIDWRLIRQVVGLRMGLTKRRSGYKLYEILFPGQRRNNLVMIAMCRHSRCVVDVHLGMRAAANLMVDNVRQLSPSGHECQSHMEAPNWRNQHW